MTYEIEIGRGKRGVRAYSLDDVAVVPTRRTRDPQDVSVNWQIDAYQFSSPIIGAPIDSVRSPATAIALGRFGGLGVLNLEGLWTRYEDPEPVLAEIASLESRVEDDRTLGEHVNPAVTARLQEL
ncbi:MAG: IMP dehydrogenase, partial [Micrococcaceae bacterium]|nr:IMP dehydrogenase [Micrococcaceae bacterium]